jgi:hypothetical protein
MQKSNIEELQQFLNNLNDLIEPTLSEGNSEKIDKLTSLLISFTKTLQDMVIAKKEIDEMELYNLCKDTFGIKETEQMWKANQWNGESVFNKILSSFIDEKQV